MVMRNPFVLACFIVSVFAIVFLAIANTRAEPQESAPWGMLFLMTTGVAMILANCVIEAPVSRKVKITTVLSAVVPAAIMMVILISIAVAIFSGELFD